MKVGRADRTTVTQAAALSFCFFFLSVYKPTCLGARGGSKEIKVCLSSRASAASPPRLFTETDVNAKVPSRERSRTAWIAAQTAAAGTRSGVCRHLLISASARVILVPPSGNAHCMKAYLLSIFLGNFFMFH